MPRWDSPPSLAKVLFASELTQGLEEHFYLNIESGRPSKNAGRYVRAYKALAGMTPQPSPVEAVMKP